LVLLDDPLSALDAGTAKLVFERLLKAKNALFSNAAVVLVTHAAHFLSQVDRLTIIVDGKNVFIGSWAELVKFEPGDEATKLAVESILSSVQEQSAGTDKPGIVDVLEPTIETDKDEKNGTLMTVEEREHGLSSLRVWLLWFHRAGGVFFIFVQVLLMATDRFFYVALEYWLARWTKAAHESIQAAGIYFPPQTDGRSAQYKYLVVYACLLFVSVIATALR
jgi:ABC-type sulfate/molybdate transport systems ATPase subunit